MENSVDDGYAWATPPLAGTGMWVEEGLSGEELLGWVLLEYRAYLFNIHAWVMPQRYLSTRRHLDTNTGNFMCAAAIPKGVPYDKFGI